MDVSLGAMLLALLLIPAVKLMGESRASKMRLRLRDAILFEAETLLEQTKISLADSAFFDAAYKADKDDSANLSLVDGPLLRQRIRIEADDTMADERLVNVVVNVWRDQDLDGQMDAAEIGETLRTQWSAP
ncbi:MAG: hypothetical protein P8L85_14620 [Rubripirellula sp.]|nr:hypothetical protein [Rubripirellula sp.]